MDTTLIDRPFRVDELDKPCRYGWTSLHVAAAACTSFRWRRLGRRPSRHRAPRSSQTVLGTPIDMDKKTHLPDVSSRDSVVQFTRGWSCFRWRVRAKLKRGGSWPLAYRLRRINILPPRLQGAFPAAEAERRPIASILSMAPPLALGISELARDDSWHRPGLLGRLLLRRSNRAARSANAAT